MSLESRMEVLTESKPGIILLDENAGRKPFSEEIALEKVIEVNERNYSGGEIQILPDEQKDIEESVRTSLFDGDGNILEDNFEDDQLNSRYEENTKMSQEQGANENSNMSQVTEFQSLRLPVNSSHYSEKISQFQLQDERMEYQPSPHGSNSSIEPTTTRQPSSLVTAHSDFKDDPINSGYKENTKMSQEKDAKENGKMDRVTEFQSLQLPENSSYNEILTPSCSNGQDSLLNTAAIASAAKHRTKIGEAIPTPAISDFAKFCLENGLNGLNLLYGFIRLSGILLIRILVFLIEISTFLPRGFWMMCIFVAFLQYVVEFVHSQPTYHLVEIQWNLTKQIVQLCIGDCLLFAIPEKFFSMYYTNDSTVQGKLLVRRKGKDEIIFSDEVLKPPLLQCQTNQNSTTIIMNNASSSMLGEYCFFSPFAKEPQPCVNVTLLDYYRKEITDQDGKDIYAWIIPVVAVCGILAMVAAVIAIVLCCRKCRACTNVEENGGEAGILVPAL